MMLETPLLLDLRRQIVDIATVYGGLWHKSEVPGLPAYVGYRNWSSYSKISDARRARWYADAREGHRMSNDTKRWQDMTPDEQTVLIRQISGAMNGLQFRVQDLEEAVKALQKRLDKRGD